jgi:hypothetical protein
VCPTAGPSSGRQLDRPVSFIGRVAGRLCQHTLGLIRTYYLKAGGLRNDQGVISVPEATDITLVGRSGLTAASSAGPT